MKRREFLRDTALMATALSVAPATVAAKTTEKNEEEKPQSKLIDSAPVLQNYAETSMGIAFSVSAQANGYVVYGRDPQLKDGRKVWCGGYRVTDMNPDVMRIRLTGLQPATTYYYRIGADRIAYKQGYDMKVIGNEEDSHIYSFTTAGRGAKAHFCVINDTHAHWDTIDVLQRRLQQIMPTCVVWNGDISNCEETTKAQKRLIFHQEISVSDYAARIPYLFAPGNHDDRGLANRQFERVWMFRQPEERSSRFWDLGRNFAVRMGDIAMIGLDTGEDKMDDDYRFANLFSNTAYREAQAEWLREALKQDEVTSAPYLVTFCHIPLFSNDPRENPGDVRPEDINGRYSEDYAAWQRTCSRLWVPLLEQAGCQLIITAHQHRFRYFDPAPGRPWTMLVGGGPAWTSKRDNDYPTIIDGEVKGGRLQVKVLNMRTDKVVKTLKISPRK